MIGGHFDLLQQLQQRLDSVTQDKTRQHELARSLDEKIRLALQKAPKRPQVPEDKLDDEIQQLEFKRNTVSMSLNEEKQLLKQIDSIKEKKMQIKEYITFQQSLDDMKQRKADALAKAKTNEQTATDLRKGLRKLDLARSAQCDPSEIITIQVEVPDNRAGGVIGKSGAKLKQIETTCGVNMEMDNDNHMVQIMGTASGTKAAKEMVEDITCSTSETIRLHPDVVRVLLNRRGILLQQAQTECGVRIDLNRSEGTAVINGTPSKIQSTKKWIGALAKGKKDVTLEADMIPILIGKGGATISKIMEESGANVEIDRDSNVARLRGTVDAVEKAATLVEELIIENEEHNDEFPVDPHFINYLVEDKGAAMKRLRKGVFIDIDRPNSLLKVRGNNSQLNTFKTVLDDMVTEFNKSTTKLPVDSHIISVIIGKGGSTIKKISADCNVKIDVDRQGLFLRLRGDDEAVKSASDAIQQIILENQRYVFGVSDEILFALTSKGRTDLLAIQEKTGCTLQPIRKDLELIITGTAEQVAAGKEAFEAFLLDNQITTIDIDPEEITNVIGPGGETITKLQQETGAVITIDKKNNTVQFRGSAEQLEAAKAAVLAITVGNGNGDNILIRVDECATPTIIGKAGATINRLRDEHNVSIDITRGRGTIRIKGEPENVAACAEAIDLLIEETIITEVIEVPVERLTALSSQKVLFREVECATSTKVTFIPKERKVRIRASAKTIGPAKRRVTMIVKDHLSQETHLCAEHMQALSSNGGMNIQRVRDQNRVSITIDPVDKKIIITGSVENVFKAQDETERLIQFYFPQHFVEISIPSSFIGAIDSKRHLIVGDTSVNVSVFRRNNIVKIYGINTAEVAKVEANVRSLLATHIKEYAEVKIDAGMSSFIVGKKGVTIIQLSEETGATIHVDSDSNVVSISGSEEAVKRASGKLNELVETYRKENLDLEIDVEDVPSIIGRGGAVIKKLQETSGASINVNGDTGLIRIHSQDPECLAKAKELILKIVGETKRVSFIVDSYSIRAVIGNRGANVRRLQEEYDVKIRLEQSTGEICISGSADKVAAAKADIEKIIAEDAQQHAQNREPKEKVDKSNKKGAGNISTPDVQVSNEMSFPSIPVGADAAMAEELAMKGNNKNARRRARRRQEQQSSGKAADVISLLVGSKPNVSKTADSSLNSLLCGDKSQASEDSSSYYHSTSGGYTLRL